MVLPNLSYKFRCLIVSIKKMENYIQHGIATTHLIKNTKCFSLKQLWLTVITFEKMKFITMKLLKEILTVLSNMITPKKCGLSFNYVHQQNALDASHLVHRIPSIV